MRRRALWAIASSLTLSCLPAVSGCGGEDPPRPIEGDDYFPTTVGSHWEYDDVHDGVTERLFKAMADCAPDLTFDDCATGQPMTFQAVAYESTGSNNAEETGTSYLIRRDDGFYRIRQDQQDAGEPEPEVVRTYSPGFFRFPRGPLDLGTSWDSSHRRCEDDTTVDPPTHTESDKSYHWQVEGVETITVPAGTFEDAVRLRRVTAGSNETKLYWYARGVGKILEQLVEGTTVLREEHLMGGWEIGTEECAL